MIKRKWLSGFFGFLALLALPSLSLAYDNSPSNQIVIPECIWAAATGGGTWISEVQIIDRTGGSVVSCYFDYGTSWEWVANIWTGPGGGHSIKISNMLSYLAGLDPSFAWYGKVGALELYTQDASHKISVAVKEYNGNYAKTMPGLVEFADSNSAYFTTWRGMIVPNLDNNYLSRATCGFFNPTGSSITVTIYIVNANYGATASFSRTFAGYAFQAFNPYTVAGIPYPTYSFTNQYLLIWPTAGAGKLICFGASANNYTNDPGNHMAVQWD
ncbi:MAG: hypothetical protein NTV82_11460 [Candidatus Aminicenantes bacterium]|nr:hypothetical protein [Candidatus Aminicenantes bacterium]